MANYHLAILKRPYLEAILEGPKTIETRFTKTKCAPFGRVSAGDILFLKESGGPVCATAKVQTVENFGNLTIQQIVEIKQRYNHQILGSEEYWQSKSDCGFGVLAWLEDVEQIKPVRISKKDWRAWVVLTEKENYGLLKTETWG